MEDSHILITRQGP